MSNEYLPERIQNDGAFGGFIGIEDIYNGEAAKQIDLSKFDGVFQKSKNIPSPKHGIPTPKKSAPVKNIKTSAGKGTSQLSKQLILKSAVDGLIKQIEQKRSILGGSGPFGINEKEAIKRLQFGKPKEGKLVIDGKKYKNLGEYKEAQKMKGTGFKTYEEALSSKPKEGFKDYDPQNPPKGKKVSENEKYGGFEKGLLGTAGGALAGGLATGGNPVGAGLGAMAGQAVGAGMKKGPSPVVRPMSRTGQNSMHKSNDISKSKAILSVEKAMYLIKSMVDGEQVDSTSQPPQDWMAKCMSEIGDENQCMLMWNKQASQDQAPWTEENGANKPSQQLTAQGEESQAAPEEEDGVDYDNLGKWMGGALQGGTLSSLLGHPIAGAAIQAAGKAIGQKILGQEVDDEQAQKIGMAAFDALESVINDSQDDSMKKAWPALAARMIPALARGAGPVVAGYSAGRIGAKDEIRQKSVVQQLDKKAVDAALPQRKPTSDFGGESEVSGDGTKGNVQSLGDKSEAQDETGKSAKIDAKKIAHNYKLK